MQQNRDLGRLEDLIASLGGGHDPGKRSKGSCELLLEHLAAARRNLLGSMCGEYAFSLEQAKRAIACISARDLRDRAKHTLQYLIAAEKV